jgi:hypothetical protein
MDKATLDESKELMVKVAQDVFPEIDTRKGTVVNEFILSMAAIGYATIKEDIQTFEQKMYLSQILEDPASADEDTLDAILSNLYVFRKAGSKAEGKVKIDVDESRTYFVNAESEFRTSTDLVYLSQEDVSVEAADLFASSDGTFYFFVDIIAEEVGSKYIIAADTKLTTEILSGNLVNVSTFGDVQKGIDKETNEALVTRAPTVISTRDMSNNQSISAIMQEKFPEIRQMTTAGYNDREMQRNLNNIGFKIGGAVDIYVRTSSDPLSRTIEKTADGDGKIVLSDIDTGEVPILRVRNIAKKSDPVTVFTDFTISVSSQFNPAYLYRFSSYEEITIDAGDNFKDTDTIVTIDYMPLIKDMQEYVDSEEVTSLLYSSLVRSYMPCFISMGISYQSTFTAAETEEKIQTTVLDYINGYNEDILYVSKIIDQLHTIDLESISLPLEITGTFHLPDGSIDTIVSEDFIKIEDNIELGASKRTYRFFMTPSDLLLTKTDIS